MQKADHCSGDGRCRSKRGPCVEACAEPVTTLAISPRAVRLETMPNVQRIYDPSPRHSEPITAESPGVKCPSWSAAIAQDLLSRAEHVGNALQATRNGVGFVGRLTRVTEEGEIWHGYPEAWDRMDTDLKQKWLKEKAITKRDLRAYKTSRSLQLILKLCSIRCLRHAYARRRGWLR